MKINVKEIFELFALKYLIDFITNKHDTHNIVSEKGWELLKQIK